MADPGLGARRRVLLSAGLKVVGKIACILPPMEMQVMYKPCIMGRVQVPICLIGLHLSYDVLQIVRQAREILNRGGGLVHGRGRLAGYAIDGFR